MLHMDEAEFTNGTYKKDARVEIDGTDEAVAGPGTQKQMLKDPKWNGIPPVGNKPIFDKWNFLMLILLVFIVKIIIWSAYRWTSGNWEVLSDPVNNYTAGIFMKPLLQLTPVFLIWWYVFRERGLPFRFTRKHLFSSIIFGCILGLLYYFVATGVLVALMEGTGQGTDFHIVAGWDDAGMILIIAMMFSYMIGTGPTEEIFSRGFLQDQTARAFPLWFAILFSAGLFAIGHLPISIFVYQLSTMTIVWYMIVLVIMGCFFSLLYQWSRNIVFPAIIHGLWDWYLSLFALRGAYSASFMADPDVNFGMMDFFSTILTLAIMLPIFYIVYLVWWKHDKPLEEGPLARVVAFIDRFKATHWVREHDSGWWPNENPIIITGIIVGLFCLAMFPLAWAIGTDDESKFADRIIGEEFGEIKIVYDNISKTELGSLDQGSNIDYIIETRQFDIKYINLSLTWEDEADIRQKTNQPDTFLLELYDSEGNLKKSAEGSTGNLEISWAGDPDTTYLGNFTATITLIDAGDQVPNFNILGLRVTEDNSNTYSLDIEVIKYTRERSKNGGSGDVRWED